MSALWFLAISLAVSAAAPSANQQRIIGGVITPVERYPYIASVLATQDSTTFNHFCGGSIINTRNVLTAAHCIDFGIPIQDAVVLLRLRFGSIYYNTGGSLHFVETILVHPSYDTPKYDSDIGIIRTTVPIIYTANTIQPALFSGANYQFADNDLVWAAGWGWTSYEQETSSTELRHAQTWLINQDLCADRYTALNLKVTDNMFCSGWLDFGGRGQCRGDSGGPIEHNGVVVGVTSWSYQCADGHYPTVNTRISRFLTWIRDNASE